MLDFERLTNRGYWVRPIFIAKLSRTNSCNVIMRVLKSGIDEMSNAFHARVRIDEFYNSNLLIPLLVHNCTCVFDIIGGGTGGGVGWG